MHFDLQALNVRRTNLDVDGPSYWRNPSVSGGSFWEQQGEGILMDIQGQLVEDRFQVRDHIHLPFLQGVQHRHQHAPGMGPGVRLRPEADLAGDDGGPQITLSEVVVGGYPSIVGPMIEPVGVSPEDLLDAVDAEMLRWRFHRRHDLRFEGSRLLGKLGLRKRLGAQPYCQGKLWGYCTDEGLHLGGLGELLFEVLDLAQQMAIAVLDAQGTLL